MPGTTVHKGGGTYTKTYQGNTVTLYTARSTGGPALSYSARDIHGRHDKIRY